MAYKGFPSNDCWSPTICNVLYDNFPNCSNSFEARKTSSVHVHVQYGRLSVRTKQDLRWIASIPPNSIRNKRKKKNGKKLTMHSETYAQLLPSTRCQPSSIRKNNDSRVQVNEYFSHLWTYGMHFNQRA